MDCQKIQGLLLDFLEGELSSDQDDLVRKHLLQCSACRRELLARKETLSLVGDLPSPEPAGDWLDSIERKIEKEGLGPEILRALLVPREKKIPLLVGALVLILITLIALKQISCGVREGEKEAGITSPASPVLKATPFEKKAIRLQQSQAGSVLILEEETAVEAQPVSRGKGAGSPLRPPERRMPDYNPFQDQHVRVYAKEVQPALEEAARIALSSGGQVINYPIKGFENMGPHERTLVFDIRTYRLFLERLQSLGRVEHPMIVRSDFVTVRLTVLPETSSGLSDEPLPER